ncbi:hypothetical protein SLA2020_380400 [Shorea laevis]
MAMDAETANRLSEISAEIGQLQDELQSRQRFLNLLLNSVRTLDPEKKAARIRAARERVEEVEGRLQALRTEQQYLIVSTAARDRDPRRGN